MWFLILVSLLNLGATGFLAWCLYGTMVNAIRQRLFNSAEARYKMNTEFNQAHEQMQQVIHQHRKP